MIELEKLRPEVRDALAGIQGEADCRCSEPYKSRGMKDPQCNHDLQDSVDVIRAELLRLADECAALKARSTYPRAELLVNLAAANERAEKVEAELAAIKAKLRPCAQIINGEVRAIMDPDDEGKYVAVLVVDE